MAEKDDRPGKDLNAQITSKGFHWRSGKTALSDASADEQKAVLGLRVDPKELKVLAGLIKAAVAFESLQARVAAPAAVDWRNNNGDWTTSIKDQKTCGACVSFASCATIEARVKIACEDAALQPDLSEAHLFFCGCGNCCGSGWQFTPALDYCKNTGVAVDSAFPYTPSDQACPPNLAPYVKIDSWRRLLSASERKDAIAQGGPVVAGMAVYSDFYAYTSGVYRHATGGLSGYHAVSVVGYDDSQQCWIAKNSWGPNWGEQGWFRIGYGESIDQEFPFYDVVVQCPEEEEPEPLPDLCRDYVPYLVRVLQVARYHRALRACLRYHVCRRGRSSRCSSAELGVTHTVLAILRRCPQYRTPFCRALG